MPPSRHVDELTGEVCLATKQLVKGAVSADGDWSLALAHTASATSDLADFTHQAAGRLGPSEAIAARSIAEELLALTERLRALR